ncbi:MAG: ParB/RepB/Spo0J family partition protein, partial [Rhodospirillaceae bacterium]
MVEKRHALGRGLDALIGDALEGTGRTAGTAFEVDIDRLSPNSYQPRSRAEDAGIDELAQSIKANGVIQPILVRPAGHGYQIIAGERRWHAAQRAGLLKVPVTVRDVPEGQDLKLLEWALIENIQREDLNVIEEALAYKRLADDFGLTQEDIAAAVGKDRSSVANILRLLKLPPDVRDEVLAGRLSMGHARAILALEQENDQRNFARDVVARGWSVRETEQMVTRALTHAGAPGAHKKAGPRDVDVHTRAAQDKLRLTLGTKVDIARKGKGGEIRIAFKDEGELIRIYEIL